MSGYLDAVAAGVVVFDGGAGTWFHAQDLHRDDFGGLEFEGCAELLNVTRPDVVAGLHRSFLDVGVDVIETNTFGGFGVPLGEYGIADRAYELSAAGAEIARQTVAEYQAVDGRVRFVAGSMGPGTKLATLGQVTYRFTESFSATVGAALFMGRVQKKRGPVNPVASLNPIGRGRNNSFVENGLSVLRDRDEAFLKIRYTF